MPGPSSIVTHNCWDAANANSLESCSIQVWVSVSPQSANPRLAPADALSACKHNSYSGMRAWPFTRAAESNRPSPDSKYRVYRCAPALGSLTACLRGGLGYPDNSLALRLADRLFAGTLPDRQPARVLPPPLAQSAESPPGLLADRHLESNKPQQTMTSRRLRSILRRTS